MRVTLRWFAALRRHRGAEVETVATTAPTLSALYAELRAGDPALPPPEALRAARNGAFAPWDAPVAEGDELAFLPPFSGG